MGKFNEYQVIGRKLPTEREPIPKLFRMSLFAPNETVAKSRYWYFLKKVSKVKKASGSRKEASCCQEFRIWLRYDSRSGTHNMYKEYREMTRAAAVEACYLDMAARHRARFRSVQIIRVAEVKAADVRRAYIQQLLKPKLRFPLPHRSLKPALKKHRSLFIAQRPSTFC
ncbi:60S ribosomal protein L20B [Entomophthora muscae]|uniref:60S ribosomal protein L20B n=1 Tax=Entomophthora muscae TaxID=34485 RepID=A0ACC2S9Z9_9FUNG|nr:60S ribosomal protein L20B [Entomophthora muscae]